MTNVFALLRLLPMSNRDKDAEILVLRHQLSVLQRQLGPDRVRFTPADRALLAALLHRLPRKVLRRLHLVVRPDTVLRWHRNVVARRHARRSRPQHPGRPRTVRSIRALVLRLVRENPGWGYRRVHGELLVLGIKVAASTVWEILHEAGIDPAPERGSATWADFLRSQAEALLACDFFEAVTLSGARLHVLAVIEHASRRIRILGCGCRKPMPPADTHESLLRRGRAGGRGSSPGRWRHPAAGEAARPGSGCGATGARYRNPRTPQHGHQVPLVPDQGPVQQLAPASADPAFHDRVHSGRLDGGAGNPGACGTEDLIERCGEAGVPAMNHELDPG
jgi:putative transposase